MGRALNSTATKHSKNVAEEGSAREFKAAWETAEGIKENSSKMKKQFSHKWMTLYLISPQEKMSSLALLHATNDCNYQFFILSSALQIFYS